MSDQPLSKDVLSFEEIEQLSDDQILDRLTQRVGQIRSAFIEIAKLVVVLKKRRGEMFNPFDYLRTLNYPKTAIDNARYSTRVWQFYVEAGAMTENEFEQLTFKQCLQLDDHRKRGMDPIAAIKSARAPLAPTNTNAIRGQALEDWVGKLLKKMYPNFSWTSPGKLKLYERGLDFVGTHHEPNSGLQRKIGVQVKFHQPTDCPADGEWLQFLAGCYIQRVTESLFITTGRLTAGQLREGQRSKCAPHPRLRRVGACRAAL